MRVVVAHFGIDHGGYVQLQLQSFALSDLIVLTYNEAAGYISMQSIHSNTDSMQLKLLF